MMANFPEGEAALKEIKSPSTNSVSKRNMCNQHNGLELNSGRIDGDSNHFELLKMSAGLRCCSTIKPKNHLP
jgi:hypothetical protein